MMFIANVMIKYLIVVINLTSCAIIYTEQKKPKCPHNWISFQNYKCFYFVTKSFYFEQAKQNCEVKLNSSLATISSKQEQTFLVDFLYLNALNDHDFWIGGEITGTSGEFRWLNRSVEVTYEAFHRTNHQFSIGEHVMLSSLEENQWCSHLKNRFYSICELFLNPIPDEFKIQTISKIETSTSLSIFSSSSPSSSALPSTLPFSLSPSLFTSSFFTKSIKTITEKEDLLSKLTSDNLLEMNSKIKSQISDFSLIWLSLIVFVLFAAFLFVVWFNKVFR